MIIPSRPLHTCLLNSLASLRLPCLALGNFAPFSGLDNNLQEDGGAAAHGNNLPPRAGQYLIRRLSSLLPRPKRQNLPKAKNVSGGQTTCTARPPEIAMQDIQILSSGATKPTYLRLHQEGPPGSEDPPRNTKQRGVLPRAGSHCHLQREEQDQVSGGGPPQDREPPPRRPTSSHHTDPAAEIPARRSRIPGSCKHLVGHAPSACAATPDVPALAPRTPGVSLPAGLRAHARPAAPAP